MNNKNRVAFHNLGCKVNSYETDAMQELLIENGYEIVPFEPGADIYIINTCTVTNIADRKSRQMLHKAKKMNPDAIVVATGCYAQVSSEEAKEDDGVDIIIGNNRKHEIVEILAEYTGHKKIVALEDINKQKTDYETLNISKTAEHTRAYIKIQDGCNQFCTYCLIPFARGRVRSRSTEDILNEVKRLAENGYREVVLTGIHISSYGSDFEGKDGKEFLRLLQEMNEIEGIDRIRLGSLEPMIMTDEFVEEIAKLNKICAHFHLSLQSGSLGTLKRMNRHYTPKQFEQCCIRLKKHFDHPALTTDIIVGFPGETKEEFEECRDFVDKIDFFETHIFKYSKRKGTRAATMENQIQESVKSERSNVLLEMNKKKMKDFMEFYIGKEKEILMEEPFEFENEKYFIGHTKEYVKVAVKTEEDLTNKLISGVIKGFLTNEILLVKND